MNKAIAAIGWPRIIFYLLQFTWGLPVNLCVHEYGHTIQCLFLGPLYWLVIAIPSVIWCYCFANYRKKHRVSYEALYCERWATAWGKKWSAV